MGIDLSYSDYSTMFKSDVHEFFDAFNALIGKRYGLDDEHDEAEDAKKAEEDAERAKKKKK